MFSAILDACVLVPSLKRDVLLEVAQRDVYRPLWSSEILDEVERTVRRIRIHRHADEQKTDAYIGRLTRQMAVAFPDALVTGWEPLVDTIELPDVNDRHVVAAAVAGRADVIVTENRTDFPVSRLPAPLFTQTTDTFLLDSYDLHPRAVVEAVQAVAARSGRHGPGRTAQDLVALLGEHGCERFAAAVAPGLRVD